MTIDSHKPEKKLIYRFFFFYEVFIEQLIYSFKKIVNMNQIRVRELLIYNS